MLVLICVIHLFLVVHRGIVVVGPFFLLFLLDRRRLLNAHLLLLGVLGLLGDLFVDDDDDAGGRWTRGRSVERLGSRQLRQEMAIKR